MPGSAERRTLQASQIFALCVSPYNQHKLGKPHYLCLGALFIAVFYGIRIDFEGSQRKYVDKVLDGWVSQPGFPNLCWL